jgi:type IV pilus assembly protein PilO
VKLSDFSNLDRGNIGGWPQSVKLVLCSILFALLLALGWWYSIKDQQDTLEGKRTSEEQLKKDFHDKQGKVVNLELLRKQVDDLRERLEQAKHQLPSKTEMPQLLTDVSQSALSAGIETQLFQPGPEVVKDGFYAEKPIQLRMLGTYHQFGTFIGNVAGLSRVVILTMHDVSLKPTTAPAKGSAAGQLLLEGTVKTYRYLDEAETEAAAPKKPAAPAAAKPAAAPTGGA